MHVEYIECARCCRRRVNIDRGKFHLAQIVDCDRLIQHRCERNLRSLRTG